ncbi:MAG: sigma-54-dependent Fis family transcriptional regulator [Planctomycetaceae bacterium]|nr:sigma-54-dependent Fis family transcriptional regulator [Planctomycetaceae bacterium]
MSKVLVIDDDRVIRHQISRFLSGDQVTCFEAGDSQSGLQLVLDQKPDVILLDVNLPHVSGLDLFERIREIDRRIPIIFITAAAESSIAIEAMQLGAYEYVTKPLDLPQLKDLVEQAVESHKLMSVPVAIPTQEMDVHLGDQFIGRSPAMLEVFKQIGRAARQKVTVLIRGESGCGKELVARALYNHSDRIEESFLAVNCAAIPDQLLESELFGHEKGAFTGAEKRRIGKFEQCNGGTIFLDEIGDMTPLVQGKVLRLLQEQRFERVGGNETIETDVRIIAATNRDLESMVEEGTFRADLYYRLNGITINLPPLNQRGEDLIQLIEYFLTRACQEMGRSDVEGISPQALEILKKYHWPGNVRELQSVIRRTLLNTTGTVIIPQCLPPELHTEEESTPVQKVPSTPGNEQQNFQLLSFIEQRLDEDSKDLYAETLEEMEKLLITRVLQYTNGNQSRASEILGITRGKIRDRIATFGIRVDKNISVDD